MLAVAPRNFLDNHRIAAAAIDAPHRVEQKNQKAPERDELETPFGKLVIAGRRLVASRTNGRRGLARAHGDFDALVIGTEAGMPVDETPEMMAAV
jgi:hypothetical protein